MKILVAVDFGEPALEALRQAREVAHATGASVGACHVLPAVHALSALFPEQSLSMLADATADEGPLREALTEHVRSKLGLELGEVFVARGLTYAEIVRRAEAIKTDLVVVGSHGRTGLSRAVLGSVAERVVRNAHCSVLVARPTSESKVVLAATDSSDSSLPAIAAGAAAAQRSGTRLVVVSALEWADGSSTAAASSLMGVLPAGIPAELRRERRDTLQSLLEQALVRAGATGEARVLDGPPASAIVACAEELGAALIVVGTHGRTGLARLALGSVAEEVIRGAHCSVLAVRDTTPVRSRARHPLLAGSATRV